MGILDAFQFFAAAVRMSPARPVDNYRLYNRLYRAGRERVARRLETWNRFLTGADISCSATIGEGLHIPHPAGIVIGGLSVIGDGCSLYPHAVLGYRAGGSEPDGHPHLGNGVIVGAGARLLGPIRIGDGAHIGANAVVLTDVPANGVAVGIPARIRAVYRDSRTRLEGNAAAEEAAPRYAEEVDQ